MHIAAWKGGAERDTKVGGPVDRRVPATGWLVQRMKFMALVSSSWPPVVLPLGVPRSAKC